MAWDRLPPRRLARETEDTARRGQDEANENQVAKELVELLTRPNGVQQAILLQEILNRPADRW